MTNLARLRSNFIIVISILGICDLIMLGYLVLPGSSRASQQTQEDSLQQQVRTMRHEVDPLRGIDTKLVKTRVDLKTLYQQNVPSRWSQISEAIQRVAHDSGVSTEAIHYTTEATDLQDVQRVKIDTSIMGDYTKVARFINTLERDKLLFTIRQISLNSQGEQGQSGRGGTVALQIKFDTFLKEAA